MESKFDEELIQKWIIEEDLFKEKIEDMEANFHYLLNYNGDHIIELIQPKISEDLLVFGCVISVSYEHLNFLNEADIKTRMKFLSDLRLTNNLFGVDFNLEIDDEYILKSITLEDILFLDGLSKNEFIKTIRRIYRAIINSNFLFDKYFY